jgi:LuxR family maltose regulon positive regulatory protein
MGPLLTTKLHVPRRRRGLVARPRLSERLAGGGDAALTLVSAPAGFGKTTLLTEWLTSADRRATAWLSLDARDNDPSTFWTYLIAALQTAVPDLGTGAHALLQEPHASLDEVLATLVNELDAAPDDLVVVLDDYHVVTLPNVHERMAFLVEHLPPHVHLVIATRADPALPVARWRARVGHHWGEGAITLLPPVPGVCGGGAPAWSQEVAPGARGLRPPANRQAGEVSAAICWAR